MKKLEGGGGGGNEKLLEVKRERFWPQVQSVFLCCFGKWCMATSGTKVLQKPWYRAASHLLSQFELSHTSHANPRAGQRSSYQDTDFRALAVAKKEDGCKSTLVTLGLTSTLPVALGFGVLLSVGFWRSRRRQHAAALQSWFL